MQYSIKTYTRRISRYYEEIQIAINGYTMHNFDHFALNQILPICNFGRYLLLRAHLGCLLVK